MSHISKRTKDNQYYHAALTVLGNKNYHLHRPEFGPSGSINLIVVMDTKHNKEVEKTLSIPKHASCSLMQWRLGFERQLRELENIGFRPPRSQFEKPSGEFRLPSQVPEPARDPVLKAQLAEHAEFDEGLVRVFDVPQDQDLMEVRLAVKRCDLRVMMDVMDGMATVISVGRAVGRPREKGSLRERIVKQLEAATGPVPINAIKGDYRRVATALSLGVKNGEFVRERRGSYRLAKKA